jgi:prepilin-type N-terminal cleavage/methylation domain-containing protein
MEAELKRAFTLIELLIVVAIIAILAAIAVPNFLEAQTRAKVSRVKADMRSLDTAWEVYYVDQNAYPPSNTEGTLKWAARITSPIAFMTTIDLKDPFTPDEFVSNATRDTLRYYGFNEIGMMNAGSSTGIVTSVLSGGTDEIKSILFFSHGPDMVRSKAENGSTLASSSVYQDPLMFLGIIYNPTNGTVSNGEILRHGGQLQGRTSGAMQFVVQNH